MHSCIIVSHLLALEATSVLKKGFELFDIIILESASDPTLPPFFRTILSPKILFDGFIFEDGGIIVTII